MDRYICFSPDGFRIVYTAITVYMWLYSSVFSFEYFEHEKENIRRYALFTVITFLATAGVMMSSSFMTAFLCFEILSFSSTVWVIHEETKAAREAAYTYLFIAVAAGLILFMGLAILFFNIGSLEFERIRTVLAAPDFKNQKAVFTAGILITLGFGAKAGIFPLHIWLPKAHPVAPAPASALLSGILTKVGIYGILMTVLYCLPDNYHFGILLLILALITMFLGALLALFSTNLKRTLACSSMSQMGFILTGLAMYVLLNTVGENEGAEAALSGAYLHMLNHSCLKLTLFMAAGAVFMNTEKLDLNEIRGFGRNKPLLKTAFLLGALGIGGIPLFNAYVSKTLIHEAITEGIREMVMLSSFLRAAEWIFLISGGFTLAYMTKLFIAIFIEKNNDGQLQEKYDADRSYMNKGSAFVIFSSSLLFIILGTPFAFKGLAAVMTGESAVLADFNAFSPECLKGGAVSVLIGAVIYIIVVRRILFKRGAYLNLWPDRLDLERIIYRPLFTRILPEKILGRILVIFAENKILKALFKAFLPIFFSFIAIASMGTDLFIIFLRKTVLCERKPVGIKSDRTGALRKIRLETSEAYAPIVGNFSFALVLTCIGIVIILLALTF